MIIKQLLELHYQNCKKDSSKGGSATNLCFIAKDIEKILPSICFSHHFFKNENASF